MCQRKKNGKTRNGKKKSGRRKNGRKERAISVLCDSSLFGTPMMF